MVTKETIAETSEIEEETVEEKKDVPPLIVVHGAASTKVGFGGELFPRFVYPLQSNNMGERIKRFPIEGSEPTNEDLLVAYWQAIINKLKVDLTDTPVLLSLPTANIAECPFRDKAQDYFITELGASKVAVISDPFLSLVGYLPQVKQLTALIVDIGFSQIRIVPIYNAAILEDHVAQISFGGYFLTAQLGKWLQQQGYEGPADALFVRDIKENFCEVKSLSAKKVNDQLSFFTYSFNKQDFVLGAERWKLPELFFHKGFFSKKVEQCPRSEFEGSRFPLNELTLTNAINFVIQSLDHKLQETLFQNICLTGGGSKFIGLKERLMEELLKSNPRLKGNIKIHKVENTDLIPFVGASKLSKLESFQNYWRNEEDYTSGLYDLFL
ncbi:MAG: hypothetical protein ACTSPT_04570 [Candidatus Heimdallarchaeota archaeon]